MQILQRITMQITKFEVRPSKSIGRKRLEL